MQRSCTLVLLGGIWPNGTILKRNTVKRFIGYPLVRNGIGSGRVPGFRPAFRLPVFLICGVPLADEFRVFPNPILTLAFHFKISSPVLEFSLASKGAQ
jgi:hypothetical protein